MLNLLRVPVLLAALATASVIGTDLSPLDIWIEFPLAIQLLQPQIFVWPSMKPVMVGKPSLN